MGLTDLLVMKPNVLFILISALWITCCANMPDNEGAARRAERQLLKQEQEAEYAAIRRAIDEKEALRRQAQAQFRNSTPFELCSSKQEWKRHGSMNACQKWMEKEQDKLRHIEELEVAKEHQLEAIRTQQRLQSEATEKQRREIAAEKEEADRDQAFLNTLKGLSAPMPKRKRTECETRKTYSGSETTCEER
jgi:hypothetical protein